MTTSTSAPVLELSLMRGGASYRVLRRVVGVDLPQPRAVVLIAIVFALATWLPLLALSAMQGLMWRGSVAEPFTRDFAPHVRCLFALPLLIVADLIVGPRFVRIGNFVATSTLLQDTEIAKFRSAAGDAMKLRDSRLSELVLIALAYIGALLTAHYQLVNGASSWMAVGEGDARHLTAAGWVNAIFSLPVFQFFLYRWIFRLAIFAWLMYRMSRLDLKLVPTHPDRAGGLGFIGEAMPAASPLVLALSSVLCSELATRVFLSDVTVEQLSVFYAIFVVAIVAAFAGPFLVFSGKLYRTKVQALMDYRALGIKWGHSFEKKWLEPANDLPMNNVDIAALTSLERGFAVVRAMKIVPLDLADLRAIIVAALLPLIPFVGTQIPLESTLKILKKVVL